MMTHKQHDCRANAELVKALLEQKQNHDQLVAHLAKRIDNLTTETEDADLEHYITYRFFDRHHRELISEFVMIAYKEEPSVAKRVVECFHEECLDLSTLGCTGSDFMPWE